MKLPQAARDQIATWLPQMSGWCSQQKGIRMAELIVEGDIRFALEIGVFGGRSLACMGVAMLYIPNGLVIGIDPWTKEAALEGTNATANDDWWAGRTSSLDLDAEHTKAFHAVQSMRLDEKVVMIRSTSRLCRRFLGAPIGMLHIDGNHSEETSTEDVRLWLPQVLPGGIVVFDDTNWESTRKAISMVELECDKLDEIDNCGFYKKRS